MKNSREHVSEVHVLGAVSSSSKEVADAILDQANRDSVIIDLSAGQLRTPHGLSEKVRIPRQITWINGQAFADECGDLSRIEYIEWLACQADEPIIGDKSIKDIFTYKSNTSLWWFTLTSEKNTEKHPLRWLFYMLLVLDKIRKYYSAQKWHIWTEKRKESNVLGDFLESEGQLVDHNLGKNTHVSFFDRCRSLVGGSKVAKILKCTFLLANQSLRTIVLHLQKNTYKKGTNKSKFDVLFQTSFPHSWTEATDEHHFDPEVEAYDRYFGSAPWDLNELDLEVAWMPTLHTRSQVQKWEEVKKRQTLPDVGEALRVSCWTTLRLIVEAWGWWLTFIRVFEIRESHREWTYKDINLGEYLYQDLWTLVAGDGLRYSQRVEQYKAACEVVQPDVVLYRDEFYRPGRAVAAALKGKAELIGVQHGLIGNEHTVYQIHESEVQPFGAYPPNHIRYNPLPDAFACFGGETKGLFKKWEGYPEERVWVTGGLRHDYIYERYGDIDEQEKKKLKIKLGLPTDRRIVLLCTGLRSEVDDWTRMTIEAILDQRSTSPVLAVKVHQYHGGEDTVRERCRQMNYTDYRLYHEQIYPLMAVSDVLVGGASTVILEAGMLGVPALVLTVDSNYRHYNFQRGGLAKEVDGTDQMSHEMRHTLEKKNTYSNSKPHMENVSGIKSTKKMYELIKNFR